MAALVRSEPWYSSLLRPIARALSLVLAPEEFRAGTDFAPYPVADDYSPRDSLSAFAALPWVRACVDAIATDLAGLPLIVEMVRPGGEAEPLPAHPMADLLAHPDAGTSAELVRQQLVLDLLMTGNAYLLWLGAREPVAMRRLHPFRVSVIPDPSGRAMAYEYNGAGAITRYPADRVIHVRAPSWEDGPAMLLGTGLVQTLHNDLTAEVASTKREAQAQQQGRPDMIASPADDKQMWAQSVVTELGKRLRQAFAENHGGIAIFNGAAKLTPLSWSPSELGTSEARLARREAVLAAFGVPPTRVQLPTANYAQSTDAMRQYWSSLQGRARMLDALWTAVAMAFDSRLRVRHDFSAVPYLQEDRSLRLQRVSTHILNGMSARDAYEYEGFRDAPLVEEPAEAEPVDPAQDPAEDAADTNEPADEGDAPTRSVVRRMPRPETEDDRATVWRSWSTNQIAVEARMRKGAARYLQGAKQRIPARVMRLVESLPVNQAVGGGVVVRSPESELEAIIGREEADALARELGPEILRAMQIAFRLTARQMGASLEWDPDRTRGLSLIGEMVQQITSATRDRVRSIVAEGLTDGESALEIARRIQDSESLFGPSRALNIARTESTNALNLGAVDARSAAQRQGVRVRKEGLSSRDGAVRPAHRALDGQVVGVGESFVVPLGVEFAGAEAKHPGDFSDPALTCNCRCTVLPVVED